MDKIGLQYDTVEIGVIDIEKKITPSQRIQFDTALKQHGFELIDDRNNELIEKMKKSVANLELYSDEDLKTSFSDYISLNVGDNFISLNNLFAEIEGITIEKYVIQHKIAKVKELLVYGDLTLSEIATKMHYSSPANLSNQFKRITGLTPTHFRQLRHTRASFNQGLN